MQHTNEISINGRLDVIRYGGIYLDMDMIVLKPLTSLRNTLGSELLPDGHTRPNGAAMFFERFRLVLKRNDFCIWICAFVNELLLSSF